MKVTVQGIQFDAHSSYLQGPAKAPPLIRKALNSGSMNMYSENGVSLEQIDVDDKGDFSIKNYFDIEQITKTNLELTPMLTLGGDHSITYPIIKAFQSKFPKLDILQIDAHPDLHDNFEGNSYSHACPFARIMEKGLAQRLVQVGIRTLTDHQKAQAERFEVEILQMKDLNSIPALEFKNPVYLTLDLDGLDPSCAPGVSHHEPGGLTTRQVMELINKVKGKLVGADIVEYNPDQDVKEMTSWVAAKFMKELIVKMAES